MDVFKRSDLPAQSEEKLIEKQKQILEWASQRARVSWLDKRLLAKKISQHLFDLIDRSGKDLADMIVQKSRADYEAFLNSHIIKGAFQVEKVKIEIESALLRESSESELRAAKMKAEIIKVLTESMQKIENSIPEGKYRNQAIKTIENLVENAISRIESADISINLEKLFSFGK